MITSPKILIYRSDKQLDDELDQAISAQSELAPVTHYFDELRAAVQGARDYQPEMVIVELTSDLRSFAVVADEIMACSPDSAVVGIFRPDQFAGEVAESTMMIQALRLGVQDFIRRPVSSRDLAELLRRRLRPQKRTAGRFGRTIVFTSNKGGVGKSTTAVNVAVELARRHPDRVLLMDGSLQMGVCAAQLNLNPQATLADAWRERDRLDERLLRELATRHDSGLDLLAAPRSAVESAEVDDAIISRILMLARRTYDYVIIDTFPLVDRVIMAILDLSDRAYIIVENVVPTLQTLRGFLELLDDLEFPVSRRKIVLNRYSRMGGNPGEAEVEQYLGTDVDHVIPFDKKVIQAANTGQPLVLAPFRFSKSIRGFRKIADEIEAMSGDSEPLAAHERNGQADQADQDQETDMADFSR